MEIGVGKARIHITEDMLPLENFYTQHDDIHVRLLWMKQDIDLLFVSFELTSLRAYAIEDFKTLLHEKTKVAKEHIMISVTHSFSSPHTRSTSALKQMTAQEKTRYQRYYQALQEALMEALKQAQTKTEVTMGIQNGYCSVNVSRDMHTKQGWWLGADDLGISDKSVQVIRFDDALHHPICILYNYDIQSSVMDQTIIQGHYEITSDLIGKCSSYIEEYLDTTAIFMLGAAGDQAPLFKAKHNLIDALGAILEEDLGEDGYVLVNALGKKLADAVLSTSKKASTKPVHRLKQYTFENTYPGQKLPEGKLQPTTSYAFEQDSERRQSMDILILDELAIVAVKPELSSNSAMVLKSHSPFDHTFVWTMVNGGAKYMPDQLAYDRITYEAMNSMFYRGSAELFVKHALVYLQKIKGELYENRN